MIRIKEKNAGQRQFSAVSRGGSAQAASAGNEHLHSAEETDDALIMEKNERRTRTVTILLALSIVVLCGVVAMVVDVGMWASTGSSCRPRPMRRRWPRVRSAERFRRADDAIHYAELNGVSLAIRV
jgi:predicted nucleic acid-binding Zn ribbon protein